MTKTKKSIQWHAPVTHVPTPAVLYLAGAGLLSVGIFSGAAMGVHAATGRFPWLSFAMGFILYLGTLVALRWAGKKAKAHARPAPHSEGA